MERRSFLGMLGGLVVLGACAAPPSRTSQPDDTPPSVAARPVQVAEGLRFVPSNTLEDWATYADGVAVATVERITMKPLSDDELQRGEGVGYLHSTVRLDDIVWQRPTLRAGLTLPATITSTLNAYEFKNGKFGESDGQPLTFEDLAWLEVRRQYVVVVARMDYAAYEGSAGRSDPTWYVTAAAPLADGAVVAFDGMQPKTWGELVAKTPDEVGARLATTEPDPRAAGHMDDDPIARWHAVQAQSSAN